MTPKKSAPIDDFVLTLSDHDSLPDEQEEEVAASSPPPSAAGARSTKKRKRMDDVAGSSASDNKKKTKKTKTSRADQHDDDEPATEGALRSSTAAGDVDDDGAMDPDFEFQMEQGAEGAMEEFEGWGFEGARKALDTGARVGGDRAAVDVDEIIARRRKKNLDGAANGTGHGDDHDDTAELVNGDGMVDEDVSDMEYDEADEFLEEDGFGMQLGSDVEESGDEVDDSDDNDMDVALGTDEESEASFAPHPDDVGSNAASSGDEDDGVDATEVARQKAFFADDIPMSKTDASSKSASFQSLSLSRPILRGLAALGFSTPTPIQAKTIPIALLGRDIVGGAVTGSGKTAAFIIPVLERLLYRPKKVPTSRVAILMPTRELAIQCHAVATKLASHTDIKFCLAVGGLSLKVQEAELRLRPDVIIATPGRFIDHMRNSASFTVDTLEILVLDEADRMLEAGFLDELNEILTTIPKSRQTMLFSATMTSSVDSLVRVGLNKPVRLMVDAQKKTVGTLVQEFVRLRPGREDKRMGYLLHLCQNMYTERVIIFFRQKKEAHRARIIFGLSGLKATELHGSMSQEQRITSIEAFRDGKAVFLLATDLASRGLDIKGVFTVINYEAPQSHEIYLHRVGRTARAGRDGRACTLAAEPDRKVVKAAVKTGRAQGARIVSRVIESSVADACQKRVDAMAEEIEAVLREEKAEKALREAEMQLRRGENRIVHEQEILARPRRTWFESAADKQRAKVEGRRALNAGIGGGAADGDGSAAEPSRAARARAKAKAAGDGKLSNKDKKRLGDERVRTEGRVWKKGRAERDGAGALAATKKDRSKDKSQSKSKSKAATRVKGSKGSIRSRAGAGKKRR